MNTVSPIRSPQTIQLMKTLLKDQSYRNYFLFVAGINIGIRICDLLKLRVKDVRNQSHLIIREQKTNKEKRFLINGNLQKEIALFIEGKSDNEFIFLSREGQGKALTRVSAWRILKSAAEEAGVTNVGTHTLRKTFGYHFYKLTKDIAMLQKIFNHTSPWVTLKYIGITQDEMDESVEKFSL